MDTSRSTLRASIMTVILGTCLTGTAQLVFVADTNLRNYLNIVSPLVDENGYLDTQNPDVLAMTSLSLMVTWSPVDLSPLAALDQLTELSVYSGYYPDSWPWYWFDDQEFSIGTWPPNLVRLTIAHGIWADVPTWPAGLAYLNYDVPTGHTAIPALPTGLTNLTLNGSTDLLALPDLPAGLDTLTLSSPDLEFPALPNSVSDLTISGVGPTAIPAWPAALQRVSAPGLPNVVNMAPLPEGTTTVDWRGPAVASLPAWPSTITWMKLRQMDALTALPPWPPFLQDLDIQELSGLSELPPYPTSLERLRIGGLSMVSLPPWPVAVDTLYINGIGIASSFPPFEPIVRHLNLQGAYPDLVSWPAPPDSLRSLWVSASDLTSLPELPEGLQELTLFGPSGLHCLPLLPESLTWLHCDGCGVECIPNLPPSMGYTIGPDMGAPPPPLCSILNSTCDFLNPVATGAVYWDQNANGLRDVGEPGYPFAAINAQPGNITYGVPLSGDFELALPLDQYTLSAWSSNPYVQSISPASHDAPFVTTTDVDSGNDFGVVLVPDMQDVRIDLNGPWGQPGFESSGHITYDNVGSMLVDGSIVLQLDADQSWVGSTPAPTTVNGNTITWDYAGLQIGETRGITITVYTEPGVPIETELQHTVIAGPVSNDQVPSDNTAVWSGVVVGSYDPNDKQVEPATLTPAEVMAGEEVIYTIRFQNTGNYHASRVIITDPLSGGLQWSTMRFINSSHTCTWVISSDGLLRFSFDPIFLPDSTSNEPDSHGYVRFAMKPVSDLMLGETVGNIANIYFDFNEPVVTNEAVFTVDASTAMQGTIDEGPRVWPNPVEGSLYIAGASGANIEVRDATGRLVHRERGAGEVHVMDLHDLAPGGYVVQVTGSAPRPFIKR